MELSDFEKIMAEHALDNNICINEYVKLLDFAKKQEETINQIDSALRVVFGFTHNDFKNHLQFTDALQAQISNLKSKDDKSINDENKTPENGKYESTEAFTLPTLLLSTPMSVAEYLINATSFYCKGKYDEETGTIVGDKDNTEYLVKPIYSVSDLRQIAEHLLVYCNANKGE